MFTLLKRHGPGLFTTTFLSWINGLPRSLHEPHNGYLEKAGNANMETRQLRQKHVRRLRLEKTRSFMQVYFECFYISKYDTSVTCSNPRSYLRMPRRHSRPPRLPPRRMPGPTRMAIWRITTVDETMIIKAEPLGRKNINNENDRKQTLECIREPINLSRDGGRALRGRPLRGRDSAQDTDAA